jgi:hypothetical protein
MLKQEIDEEKFEKELLPIFEKIKFSSADPFRIPPLKNIKEYDSFFYFIFHGAIYKTLLTIKEKDKLSHSEYIELYERCITNEVFNGETTVFYHKEPILKISKYKDEASGLTAEQIFPLYTQTIENDMNILSKIKKQEESNQNFLDICDDFKNDDTDVNFDDFN